MTAIAKISIPQQAELNQSADKSPLEQIKDFTGKSQGAVRTLALGQQTIKLVNAINTAAGSAPVLKELESKLGAGRSVLAIPYLPIVVDNARKSVEESVENPNDTQLLLKAVRNTSEATAVATAVGGLLFPTLGKFAGPFAFGEDATDVVIRSRDLVHCNAMLAEIDRREEVTETRVTKEVKVAVSDTKAFTLMRLIKAVCGAVAGFFGLGLLATGFSAPLAIALCLISLVSTVSALTAEFFKESRMYNLVSL